MVENDELPPIDEALIRELDRRFPLKFPELDDPERKIWYTIGQRSVVEFLIEHRRKQFEERLD